MKIVIINGPNLNLLGRREPAIYGTRSMEQVLLDIQRAYPELHIAYHQSNHEGDLIDWVQEYGVSAYLRPICSMNVHSGHSIEPEALHPKGKGGLVQERLAMGDGQEVDGVVLNAGGYTHTSIALRDAVACSRVPVVEVHVSDIMQREPFRQISLLTDVCAHSVIGQGTDGYRQAVEWILNRTTQHTDE